MQELQRVACNIIAHETTALRMDGIFNYQLSINSPLCLSVTEFWKSVSICTTTLFANTACEHGCPKWHPCSQPVKHDLHRIVAPYVRFSGFVVVQ